MKARIITLGLIVLAGATCAGKNDKGTISASGTIEAVEVNVASKVSGQLMELGVDEGARVKPGDRLASIDHAALDIQLRQAEAGVELADAQLALLVKGARSEDIRQAEAALKHAEASFSIAEEDARRMRELAKTGSVTPKQRDDAEARLTMAAAQRNAAAEALNKVRRLAQARAAADLLRKTIGDCEITAPAAGIVTHKAVEAGELVTPGQTIVTISHLDSVYVMIYVTARELGRVRLGGDAEIKIDAFPDKAFPGKITYISPEAEFTPKNVQTKEDRVKLVFGVKVEIDNPEGLLKPGLPADALIRVGPDAGS